MLLLLKELVAESYSRSDKFCHPSPDYFLCELRVLQLVTHSHLVAGTDKLRKVHVDGMIWEAGQRHGGGGAVGPFGKHDSEDLARYQGIISECLIEISYPEQQHCLRVFRLDFEILLHQRSLRYLLLFHHPYRHGMLK